jgi:4-hydroxybenzoate polyprenyltransferase
VINRILKQFVNAFFLGNIYLSLCAVALLWTTYLRIGVAPRIDSLTTFVFFATLFQYTLHRFLAYRKRKDSDNEVIRWTADNQFLLLMLGIVSGGMAANVAFHLQRDSLMALIPLGLLSVFYELPVFKIKDQSLRLRDIWFFKIILITLVWTSTTVMLPFLQYEVNIFSTTFIILFFQKACIVFMVALTFDVRDMEYDRRDHVITIPVRYGLIRVRKLMIFITTVCVMAGVFHALFLTPFSMPLLLVAQLGPLLAYYIITVTYRYPIDLVYVIAVDGILAMEFLLIILFQLLF